MRLTEANIRKLIQEEMRLLKETGFETANRIRPESGDVMVEVEADLDEWSGNWEVLGTATIHFGPSYTLSRLSVMDLRRLERMFGETANWIDDHSDDGPPPLPSDLGPQGRQ